MKLCWYPEKRHNMDRMNATIISAMDRRAANRILGVTDRYHLDRGILRSYSFRLTGWSRVI